MPHKNSSPFIIERAMLETGREISGHTEGIMGIYINPGNKAFRVKRNGKYVDKSGLIGVVNRSIGQPNKLSCISRPRRFGKSYAAQMLCA